MSKEWSKQKKLSVAIALATIFCIVEIVGGMWAHSLAILSDAAHLLTDIMGFAISLAAVIVSEWAPSGRYSYGFKRAEIVGAMLSILIIWVLTGWLLVEAFNRLYSYFEGTMEPVDGKLMSGVALFGICVNILIALVFHDAHDGGFSFHDHSGHDHGHGHSHGSEPCSHHDEVEMSSSVKSPMLDHGHGHGHGHNVHEEPESLMLTKSNPSKTAAGYGAVPDCSDHGHGHGHEHSRDNDPDRGHGHGHGHEHNQNSHDDGCSGHGHGHNHSLACDSHDVSGLQGSYQGQPGVPSTPAQTRDVNMEAAYMHVLSDLISGVGVLISGLLIWYDEKFLVVDPICTLIFAGMVLRYTLNIVHKIFNVLFEGVPDNVDYFAIKRGLEALPGVTEVHHLHIWSVNSDLNCMSCHICVAPVLSNSNEGQTSVYTSTTVANYHRDTLRAAKKVCIKNNVGLLTIQIEDSNGVVGCATHECDLNCAGPIEELAL